MRFKSPHSIQQTIDNNIEVIMNGTTIIPFVKEVRHTRF